MSQQDIHTQTNTHPQNKTNIQAPTIQEKINKLGLNKTEIFINQKTQESENVNRK